MKLSNILVPVCAAILLLAACNSEQKPAATETNATEAIPEEEVSITALQYKAADIATGTVESREMGTTVKVNGMLDVPPQQKVGVSVPIGGVVKSTDMLQGTHVHKGEVIATMEHMDYVQLQQDYLDVKSQYEYAETEYNRQQELATENVNAKKTLQQAKANYQSYQAKYVGLKAKLKLLHINPETVERGTVTSTINVYAPINGYITDIHAQVGQYMSPNDILFRIVNTEHIHAELTVFEKDIAKVAIGQKVRFTLANETKERTGTIHLVGKEINGERNIRVHCHLDSEDPKLLPGTFLTANIETGGATVYALPNSAIMKYEGKDYIFSVEGMSDSTHRYKMLQVTTGATDQGYTEVQIPEGYDANSLFVTDGAYTLLAKMKNSEEE